jgi:5-methylcytosine-specific restriction enzyme A
MKPPKAAPPPASRYDRQRLYKHLYNSSRWINDLRPAILRRDIICVVCKRRPSDTVDHKRDHRGNEKLFYDAANLRGVCKPCHDAKTGSQHGVGERKEKHRFHDQSDGIVRDEAAVKAVAVILPDIDYLKLMK